MNIIIEHMKELTLRDGTKITPDEDTRFPALDSIKEVFYACKICPIYEVCEGNNEIDCQIYGMFSGGNFYVSDLIKVCEEARKYRALQKL